MCCSTNLSNGGRQNVMAKHKSHSQKELHAKRKKKSWNKSVDPAEKEKLLSHRAEWYRSLDPKEKEKLFFKSTAW